MSEERGREHAAQWRELMRRKDAVVAQHGPACMCSECRDVDSEMARFFSEYMFAAWFGDWVSKLAPVEREGSGQ